MSDISRRGFPWATSFLALLAFLTAAYAIAFYLTGNAESAGFTSSKKAYQTFEATPLWSFALVLHAGGGALALLTGTLQWLVVRVKRTRTPGFRTFHRTTGTLYALSVAAASVGALIMAPTATGGVIAMLGFLTLDVMWVGTTARAAYLGWRGDKARHRAWMLRTYALTAGAITLRLWLPLLIGFGGLDFLTAYQITAWLSWIPNLLVAEVMARRSVV